VEWSVTPRLIFHPGPAPRFYISPVAFTVRDPAWADVGGIPYRAILAHTLPTAVIIEIFGAGHVGVHVATRAKIPEASIAVVVPLIEAVRPGESDGSHLNGVDTAKVNCLAAHHRLIDVAAADLQAASFDNHAGTVIGVDINPVRAGPHRVKRAVRCVDLDGITGRELINSYTDGALSDSKLHELIGEIGHG
jgi:hypothetical protein